LPVRWCCPLEGAAARPLRGWAVMSRTSGAPQTTHR
jgi:hypothetical protein